MVAQVSPRYLICSRSVSFASLMLTFRDNAMTWLPLLANDSVGLKVELSLVQHEGPIHTERRVFSGGCFTAMCTCFVPSFMENSAMPVQPY